MNSQELPQWTEDLSGRAAPEPPPPPAQFLAAVRARRISRRVTRGSALVLSAALVLSLWSLVPSNKPSQLANKEHLAPPVRPETPAAVNPEGPVSVTLAKFYVPGAAQEHEADLVAGQDSEPVLRGGDRLDLDEVRKWVLN